MKSDTIRPETNALSTGVITRAADEQVCRKEGTMKDGFVAVEALIPELKLADVEGNASGLRAGFTAAAEAGAKLIVTPELGMTGASCADLFLQKALQRKVEQALELLVTSSQELDAVIVVGLPAHINSKLYDCAAVFTAGRLVGLVPKRVLSTSAMRYFIPGPADVSLVDFAGYTDVPFGSEQLFCCETMPDLRFAVEFGDDLLAPRQPSQAHTLAGATLIANLCALPELVTTQAELNQAVCEQSARHSCAYLLAAAGTGESSTDYVYAGHGLIYECGEKLAELEPFKAGYALSEIDVERITHERQHRSDFRAAPSPDRAGYPVSYFSLEESTTRLSRSIEPYPFVPSDETELSARCERILNIQAQGLARRLQHVGSTRAILGVSGGLDSTLALLVTARAFDLLGFGREGILAVTMPGFGTTGRTYDNACKLSDAVGATLLEVDISDAVRQHFADIGHDEDEHDATYENAQARERTQVLMDIANTEGGLVVGTGDLSELALGWATYNGDHMSMYGVNASIPKTLIRHLVRHVAETCGDEQLAQTLDDVLDTPVSPELLPAEKGGTISQRTEDIVGPYELHDFFLYQMLRYGFGPAKILCLAEYAWGRSYDQETIVRWLKVFYQRFFSQQFKRSCLPDGPAVGSVAVSPRGGLSMPSDALANVWLDELEHLGA